MRQIVASLVAAVLGAGCIEVFQQEVAGDKGRETPAMSFMMDEPQDQVVVSATQSKVRWSELNITGDQAGSFRLNDGPIKEFGPTRQVAVGVGDAAAGDKIEFCLSSPESLQVRLLHTPSNAIMYEATFNEVSSHEWCS